jgi:hypothetical protein
MTTIAANIGPANIGPANIGPANIGPANIGLDRAEPLYALANDNKSDLNRRTSVRPSEDHPRDAAWP